MLNEDGIKFEDKSILLAKFEILIALFETCSLISYLQTGHLQFVLNHDCNAVLQKMWLHCLITNTCSLSLKFSKEIGHAKFNGLIGKQCQM